MNCKSHQARSLLITVLLAVPVFLFAQTDMSLNDSIEAALVNNSALQQQLLLLETAQNAAKNRWNILLPSISLSAGISHTDSVLSDVDVSSDSISLGSSVQLNLGTGTSASIKSSVLDYEIALLNFESAHDQLVYSVKVEFYKLLLAEQQLRVLEDDLELVVNQYEQAGIQFDNGYLDESSYLQSQLELESARLAYSQGRVERDLQRMALQNVIGIDFDEYTEFSGEITPETIDIPEANELYSLIDGRIDIQLGEYNLEIARLGLVQTKSSLLPRVSLSSNWNFNQQLVSNAELGDSFSLGVSVSLPVDSWIPGSSAQVAVRQAENSISSLELELTSLATTAEYEIRSLVSQLNQVASQLDIARLQLNIATKSYDLAEQGFESGTVERLELEQARTRLLESRMSLLDSQFNYAVGIMDLEAALNIDDISFVLNLE